MKKHNIVGLVIVIIALILIVGMSIWLGFPSPNFDRTALACIVYLFGSVFTVCGFVLAVTIWD